DFFVLGNIQRIRGLLALEQDDEELAVHHFSRGLTIFEAAEDLYHTALMHYLVGANLDERNASRARRNLRSALDIFKRLRVKHYIDATSSALEKLETIDHQAKPT